METQREDAGLEPLLEFLKSSRGVDFTGYKPASLSRRIRRRMDVIGVESFERYREHLDEHPDEIGALFNSILINVTSFFRDPEAWEFVRAEVVPRILRSGTSATPVRVWSAGCASGEEPFTAAMLFAETMGMEEFTRRVKIYATDWDEDALEQARRARYRPDQVEHVPDDLRAKYFVADDGHLVLRQGLRRGVIFGRHDLVEDSPISRLDLLICRNTLMYFNAGTQARILARLYFALRDSGYLFLGRAEMLLSHSHYFTPLEMRHRVFVKSTADPPIRDLALTRSHEEQRGGPRSNHLTRLRELAYDKASLAQIVIDAGGRLALFNQRAAQMFQLAPADTGKPLQDLELSYRPVDLRSMLDATRTSRQPERHGPIERVLRGGDSQYLELVATPLLVDGELIATAITFADITQQHQLQQQLRHFSETLETAYEELQSSNEELETTNEELHSSNEELETTNEELQAASEEMETINEELRSTNEELQHANELLREGETELNRTNTFLQAILGSLRCGVAVIGKDFRILLWNPRAEELWGMRADEVQGSSFLELDIGLPVSELAAALAETFRSGKPAAITLGAVNRRGRAIECHVTINAIGEGPGPDAVTLLMEEEGAR
jgi:two-component system CheB/CheR fusion protein